MFPFIQSILLQPWYISDSSWGCINFCCFPLHFRNLPSTDPWLFELGTSQNLKPRTDNVLGGEGRGVSKPLDVIFFQNVYSRSPPMNLMYKEGKVRWANWKHISRFLIKNSVVQETQCRRKITPQVRCRYEVSNFDWPLKRSVKNIWHRDFEVWFFFPENSLCPHFLKETPRWQEHVPINFTRSLKLENLFIIKNAIVKS